MADRYEFSEMEKFRVVHNDFVLHIYKELAISYYIDEMCDALNEKPVRVETGTYKLVIRKLTAKGRRLSYIPGTGSIEIETQDIGYLNKVWYNARNHIERYQEFEEKMGR